LGTLDDGTVGLAAIKRRGGLAIVQDPDDALFSGMPASAIANIRVDHVTDIIGMARLLGQLTREELPEVAAKAGEDRGAPSGLTCPECNGALVEHEQDGALQFRCHVGHAYSVDTMLSGLHESRERSLWAAVRLLNEHAMLARRIAERARTRGDARLAERFERQAEQHLEHAAQVRAICMQTPSPELAE